MTTPPDRGDTWRRLPLAHFPAVYLEHLLSIAGLVLSGLVFSTGGSWLGRWGWPVVIALLALRMVQPLYTWSSVRYRITDSGVWMRTGLLNRRTVSAAWGSISAVQLDTAWYYRPFGLTQLMLLQGGGSEAGSIRLPSIDLRTAAGIVAATERTRVRVTDPDDPPGQREAVVLYAASVADLLLATSLYGRAPVVGAAGAIGVLDLLGSNSTGGAGRGGTVALLLLVVVVLGALGSVLRFGGLRTLASEDAITIRYGLFSTRQRVIPWQAVVGVELRRNPLEMLLGRVRLSIVSMDSSTRLGSNLVLPSLRSDAAVRIIRASPLRAVLTDHDREAPGRSRALGIAVVTFGATVVPATAAALLVVRAADARPVFGVATFLIVYLALRAAGSTALASAHFVSGASTLAVTSRYISERLVVLDVSSVHVLSTLTVKRTSVLARFHYYGGRPRVLSAAHFYEDELRSLALALGPRSRARRWSLD